MSITIFSQTKKAAPSYLAATNEYAKRLSRFTKLQIKYNCKNYSPESKKNTWNILVAPGNMSPSSPMLSEKISTLQTKGYSNINFYISNSNQYSPDLFDDYISISSFTMSEDLTLVALTEQIYRSFCILNNITYHK